MAASEIDLMEYWMEKGAEILAMDALPQHRILELGSEGEGMVAVIVLMDRSCLGHLSWHLMDLAQFQTTIERSEIQPPCWNPPCHL